MNRTQRIILAISAVSAAAIGLIVLGTSDADAKPEIRRPPRADPGPELEPSTPDVPEEDADAAGDDEEAAAPDDSIEDAPEPELGPFIPSPSPPIPPPADPPPPGGNNTASKWGPRHELLADLGYWSGATQVPASAKTVDAIRAFQIDTEAARNVLQGESGTALTLSQIYGQIAADGMWGPEVAAWAQWARDNYGLFYQAVQATSGHQPGANSPANS